MCCYTAQSLKTALCSSTSPITSLPWRRFSRGYSNCWIVDEQNAQVILVSHHPELLNQLAGQGGVLLDRPNGGETRVLAFSPPDDSGLMPSEIIARGWELPAGSQEGTTHRVKRLYTKGT